MIHVSKIFIINLSNISLIFLLSIFFNQIAFTPSHYIWYGSYLLLLLWLNQEDQTNSLEKIYFRHFNIQHSVKSYFSMHLSIIKMETLPEKLLESIIEVISMSLLLCFSDLLI